MNFTTLLSFLSTLSDNSFSFVRQKGKQRLRNGNLITLEEGISYLMNHSPESNAPWSLVPPEERTLGVIVPSGFCVIDIDHKVLFQRFLQIYKETPLCYEETPRGGHLFFRDINGVYDRSGNRQALSRLGLPCEVFCEGSRITMYGRDFHATRVGPLPEAFESVRARGSLPDCAPGKLWDDRFEIPEGSRHDFLVRWGALSGLNPSVLNKFWCVSNPLPDDEVQSIETWQDNLPETDSGFEEEDGTPGGDVKLLLRKGHRLPLSQRVELTVRLLLENMTQDLYFSEEYDEWFIRNASGLFQVLTLTGNVELKISNFIAEFVIDKFDPSRDVFHFMESKDFAQRVEHLLRKRRMIRFSEPEGLAFLNGVLQNDAFLPAPVIAYTSRAFLSPRGVDS